MVAERDIQRIDDTVVELKVYIDILYEHMKDIHERYITQNNMTREALEQHVSLQFNAATLARTLADKNIDLRFQSLEDTTNLRFTNIDKATELAREALNKRLESMNEFRAQLSSQAAVFISRAEHEAKLSALQIQIEALDARIQSIERGNANLDGKMYAIGLVFAVVTTLVSIGLHFIK